MIVVAIVAGIVVLALVIFLIARRGRSADGVNSFRRQIDALSHEARRPTLDHLQDNDNDDDEPGGRADDA